MKAVVLFASEHDALVGDLRQRDVPADYIHIDELAGCLVADSSHVGFGCELPRGLQQSLEGAFCINRTQELGATRFASFFGDRNLDSGWAHWLLGQVLGSCARIAFEPGRRGVSRALLPLPSQWWHIDRTVIEVAGRRLATPRFHYPFGGEAPVCDDFLRPVFKSVWDLFNWRDRGEHKRGIDRFVADRPEGRPALCVMLGDSYALQFLDDNAPIAPAAYAGLVRKVREIFRCEWGEMLLFVDRAAVTFAAFSVSMQSSVGTRAWNVALGGWRDSMASGRTGCVGEVGG